MLSGKGGATKLREESAILGNAYIKDGPTPMQRSKSHATKLHLEGPAQITSAVINFVQLLIKNFRKKLNFIYLFLNLQTALSCRKHPNPSFRKLHLALRWVTVKTHWHINNPLT